MRVFESPKRGDWSVVKRTARGVRCLEVGTWFVFITAVTSAQAGPKDQVTLDGSSTVAPIMMAAAELYLAKNPSAAPPTVGISGTGGGFKKFLDERPDLRTDINNASRFIQPQEVERANKLGVAFIELPIAMDGMAMMVHPTNTFCDHLSLEDLKRIWEPGSAITNWQQVRAGFPDLPLRLYGPGTDSGTFDYFTEVVVGKAKASRTDYTASESDNMLVRGIEGDRGALGYFGFSYYEANKAKLRLVAIDGGDGRPIKPTLDLIRAGTYRPLARPLFLYVNKEAYNRAEVKTFLEFFLDHAKEIVEHPRVNYVALPPELYELGRQRLKEGRIGSVMARAGAETANLLELFRTAP